MRGADVLVKTLANAGVDVIYSLSGNQIMPVYDACIDAGIKIIHTRHEGAAVYMAEAHAQLTGGIGVALITAAPGFASGLGPLFMARAAESPLLLLSGDSPVGQDGMGAFQEFDQVAVSSPMTKFSKRPMRADELGADTAEAIRIAKSGRPGPVHLALAFDVLNANADDVVVPEKNQMASTLHAPNDKDIETVIAAVASAARPVILTGPLQNRTRAAGRLERLADALDAPVIPMESPRGLNDPLLGGMASKLQSADVIVSIGKDIDFTTGFGKPPKMSADCSFYMFDPEDSKLDRAERAMGSRMQGRFQADAIATSDALIAAGKGGDTHAAWRKEMSVACSSRPSIPNDASASPMHPAVMGGVIEAFLNAEDEPILIVDGGEVGQWAQAFINAPVRMINGPSGAIGGCLCYALAAKVARPNATVVVVMGDGTAGFHFSELETAHRYGADFIAVIGHDMRWNAEYQIQMRDFGSDRIYETELNETRYDLAAAGFGCHGGFAATASELKIALTEARQSRNTSCIVARIEGLPAPSGTGH